MSAQGQVRHGRTSMSPIELTAIKQILDNIPSLALSDVELQVASCHEYLLSVLAAVEAYSVDRGCDLCPTPCSGCDKWEQPECNCGNRHKIASHQHGSDRNASLPPCPYGEWLKEKSL